MTNLQIYLESALSSVISSWNEKDIYAISFLVCANEAYEYGGCSMGYEGWSFGIRQGFYTAIFSF